MHYDGCIAIQRLNNIITISNRQQQQTNAAIINNSRLRLALAVARGDSSESSCNNGNSDSTMDSISNSTIDSSSDDISEAYGSSSEEASSEEACCSEPNEAVSEKGPRRSQQAGRSKTHQYGEVTFLLTLCRASLIWRILLLVRTL